MNISCVNKLEHCFTLSVCRVKGFAAAAAFPPSYMKRVHPVLKTIVYLVNAPLRLARAIFDLTPVPAFGKTAR